MGEVYKPSDLPKLNEAVNKESGSSSGKMISDLNELLKNANSIINTIASFKNKQAGADGVNIGAKIEKGVQAGLSNQMQSMNPEAYVKPELRIDSVGATQDLMKRLDKLNDDNKGVSLEEAVNLVKELNTSGILEPQIESWMKMHCQVK